MVISQLSPFISMARTDKCGGESSPSSSRTASGGSAVWCKRAMSIASLVELSASKAALPMFPTPGRENKQILAPSKESLPLRHSISRLISIISLN